jgi:hypothetical protein
MYKGKPKSNFSTKFSAGLIILSFAQNKPFILGAIITEKLSKDITKLKIFFENLFETQMKIELQVSSSSPTLTLVAS